MLSKTDELNQWSNLDHKQQTISKFNSSCSVCGGFHMSSDHWKFMAEDMPREPVEMIDDLIKMGVYKPKTLKVAQTVNAADIRKTLLLRAAGKGDPQRERLVLELAKQAGGIENAFAAAFGANAGEFFGDVVHNSEFSRRRFLKNLAVGAALVSLTNCAPNQPSQELVTDSANAPVRVDNLEKKDLRIGFIP